MEKFHFKFLLIPIIFLCFNECYSTPINSYINSVSPSMNASSVVKSSNIQITFSQDMNGSLITDSNIKLFGYQSGLLRASLDYNSVSNILTINPVKDFKNGEKISLTLTSGLKTISGERISPFILSFYARALGGIGYFTKTFEIEHYGRAYFRSGDIDGDGDIDLILNNEVYKNNGIAEFSLFTTLDIIGIPELADFDNDEDLDILIFDNDSTVYFFRNSGNGDFTQIYNFPGRINSIGDINGDGFLDLIFYKTQSDIRIKENDNGILLNNYDIHLTGDCINEYTFTPYLDNILVEDFNNDGKTDIISSSGWTGGYGFHTVCRDINKMINNGNGSFTLGQIVSDQIVSTAALNFDYIDTRAFDINNDGFVDIFTPSRNLFNNHNSGFVSEYSNIYFCNSAVADFNGDQNIDVVADIVRRSLITYTYNGHLNFNFFTSLDEQFDQYSTCADFDNDGDIDIAIRQYRYSTDKIAILLNGDSPLPVELNSFSHNVNINTITLNWSTSSEINNSGFDIERKVQNGDWSKIGFVKGIGNSSNTSSYFYSDNKLSSGNYTYRLKQIDFNGNFRHYELGVNISIEIPDKFFLSQNYPNPFNPVTNINFSLPYDGKVNIELYDMTGRKVMSILSENVSAGNYSRSILANDLSSGVYVYRLNFSGEAINFTDSKRMVVLK